MDSPGRDSILSAMIHAEVTDRNLNIGEFDVSSKLVVETVEKTGPAAENPLIVEDQVAPQGSNTDSTGKDDDSKQKSSGQKENPMIILVSAVSAVVIGGCLIGGLMWQQRHKRRIHKT